MAVKSHITFIDLKKRDVCQKLFHFPTRSVGPIKDIIPLNILHLCHNIHGLTVKDCTLHSIRHKHPLCRDAILSDTNAILHGSCLEVNINLHSLQCSLA